MILRCILTLVACLPCVVPAKVATQSQSWSHCKTLRLSRTIDGWSPFTLLFPETAAAIKALPRKFRGLPDWNWINWAVAVVVLAAAAKLSIAVARNRERHELWRSASGGIVHAKMEMIFLINGGKVFGLGCRGEKSLNSTPSPLFPVISFSLVPYLC